MEKLLQPGMAGKVEKVVEKKDTANAWGSGNVEVLSTPAMIALMEKAALSLIEPFLEDGVTTVGIRIDVRHLSATPVGMKVVAEAELTEVKGKQLTFRVVAYDEREVIGSGMHERYMVLKKSFLARVADK